jgi:HEAT repeat protein
MKNLVLTIVLLSLVLLASANAQRPERGFSVNEIKNLTTAIQSENYGLKRSAIYLAGKYEMEEVSDVLIQELKKSNDPSTRILIALSLYKIGTEAGLEAVNYLSSHDINKEVRRISVAILNQVEMEKDFRTVSIR